MHRIFINASKWLCISFDDSTEKLAAGICPYSYKQRSFSEMVNSSVTYNSFNEVMCGPLNRRGLLCSKCKTGYGIPVFSKLADECVKCGSKITSWLLYLALELIPLTLLYILVIVFKLLSYTSSHHWLHIFLLALYTNCLQCTVRTSNIFLRQT